jgi:N-acetylglucosamine kinase-like BadF-type ATPase
VSLNPSPFGLGIDAGGSATRWSLIDAGGRAHAQGEVAGFSASMLGTVQQPHLDAALDALAAALRGAPRPTRVFAGLTGHDGGVHEALCARIARALGIEAGAVTLASDIELAWRAVFATPGRGILVLAGTGSIAAHLRADGGLERAGGRGSLLDDGGSGHWIAREALRAVWRREDEVPGAWTHSALARALFAALGGAEWQRTRAFVAAATRGEIGALATAVAAAARAGDAEARAILDGAGRELARIAHALLARCGAQPVAVAGRVPDLHEAIVAAMRAALPPGTVLTIERPDAARAAARLALGLAPTA